MQIKLDTSEFERKLQRLVQRNIPAEIEKGMGKAGLQLMNDAVMQSPTVPLDEGTLRASGSLFVANKLMDTSGQSRKRGTPALEHQEKASEDQTIAVVGFNTPYAARMHEGIGIKNWSEPGSGPKFLEAKMANNRKDYMKIVADHLQEAEG